MGFVHLTVLAREVVEFLKPKPGGRYLDGTLGGGGHAEAILTASSPDGEVLGLDWDDDALAATAGRLGRFGARFTARRGSFAMAAEALGEIGWASVDGAVLDLGVSSHHLDTAERGFSFRRPGRLDMRMDRRETADAFGLVNGATASELEGIFRRYGEERRAKRIAAAIVAERRRGAIETTADLAGLIERTVGRRQGERHPATLCFQALRIAVNRELEQLERFLAGGYELLAPGARLAIISFHSLEDRLVKSAFRLWGRQCVCPPRAPVCNCGWSRKGRVVTRKPVAPSPEECERNPRARSARLRVVERI